ncbi:MULTISPECIES: hypothetical protein [Pseudomonas]|uniref:hypothetical protein n=1 Tax=Pseudomonas TaxID=286 RepID=UPI00053E783C|nr:MULTISPECIES: hypothetical protein [Pseudomonas]KSG87545.1 hypothetical protein AO954_20980 [Pseudomonas aeruginosa]MBA5114428.1 hypothetical protein [Pseudomonas aeruginosa]RPN92604.1 hypothetical protein IPC1229_18050 [Pseudomonas aeruginosa]HBN9776545.1 hypothetical protein [Pseudomonas aeruginosa]HBO5610682.1 hypothetical protein [Pseudomonas aeruginosa]
MNIAAIEQVAAACGVTADDVEAFAQLTATQYRKGLHGEDAINAAHAVGIDLANRAFRSIQEFDSTNPYATNDSFAHTLHILLGQA